MKRRPVTRALLLAAGLSASACLFAPENPRVAGGTIETTNGIAARVVLPSGRPASNIKVFLIDENGWLIKVKNGKSIYLDSVVTDSTGAFTIKKDTGVQATLTADAEDYGILIRNVSQDMIKEQFGGVIGLRRHRTYSGSMLDSNATSTEVLLAGTPYASTVDSLNKTFTFSNVAPEDYRVVVKRVLPDDSVQYVVAGDVDLTTKDSIAPDPLVTDTTKIITLEDFEDGDSRTLLGPILGDGYWRAYDDSFLGGNSQLLQPVNGTPGNFTGAIQDVGAPRHKALQVLYKLGDTSGQDQPFPWVYVEADIGAMNSHYNLSALDTLSFFAKGNGKIFVQLIQNQPGIPFYADAEAGVTLTDAWQEFKITPSQFTVVVSQFPANPSDYNNDFLAARLPVYTTKPAQWRDLGGMVRTIRFEGTGGNEFWLDLIRLHGVTLSDLVK